MSDRLMLTLKGHIPLSFQEIPAGAFCMGSPETEAGHEAEEAPQRRIMLTRDFRMSVTPITRAQWAALVGDISPRAMDTEVPMTDVSWMDAQRFIAKLAEAFSDGYFRLPTEAEWEYACRAGSSGLFSDGETEADLARLAWYSGNSGGQPHPVGKKATNAWGLYDMHGNVFEWCQDWDGPYPSNEQTDPDGPLNGEKRILRGGCFKCPPPYCRSANRYSALPDDRAQNFGFRVVWIKSKNG
ncbi:MAG: formylglycine-generating enzyme family protein [Kiritimatiellae bacterium]|nr:formylglycine-generating enzyme family protein [Kiritimatiellia bacterium]MDD5520193.1 formylglycine-generating enzyme family protein [Kiritimatiellia bacterium]